MIPIPAIDIKHGKVVRLLQGDFKEEKIYFDSPDKVAKNFEEQGAQRIHIVDLEGALRGKPGNQGSIEKILRNVKTPVEVGGGIRNLDTVREYLSMGARWVILGTKASMDKGFMREAFAEFKQKVIIGIDAMNGFIATDGWTHITKVRAAEFAKEVETAGGKTIIYTDISKDGMLQGPNLKEIKKMSQSLNISLIASGGVHALEDLTQLAALGEKNISGVIIGKALYENKFTLKDAIRACSPKE